MSAVRMDGKALSAKVRGSILAETEELKKKGVTPGLAVIIVGGQDIALDTLLKDMCKNPFVKGVTFSGGEPFCKAEPLYRLAVELKSRGKHLMAYSGYTFEELMQLSDPYVKKLLGELDLLVDGRFLMEEKNIDLRFRGSANQRVLDVPKSLEAGAPVWAEQYR